MSEIWREREIYREGRLRMSERGRGKLRVPRERLRHRGEEKGRREREREGGRE